MKRLVFALVLAAPAIARADAYVELAGGLDIPASDDKYTDSVDPSANLSVRVGGGGRVLGGMFSADWTPLSSNIQFVTFQRFRFLGHLVVQHPIAPKIQLALRFGAGIDLLHESAEADIPVIGHVESSDSDVGLALEVAGGAWFSVGSSGSTQLGVELSVPISVHSKDGNPNNPNDPNDPQVDYTGVDIDILAGVRLRL